ncbi:MAG: hypothetical protein EXQ63_01885 [Ilumatobacteraceae bacterium]|nr:hypothetical protein [Ilumatobacteraceae bacterium]
MSAASLQMLNTNLAKNAVFPKGTFTQKNNAKVWYDMYQFTKALSRKSSVSLAKMATMARAIDSENILVDPNPDCKNCPTLGVTTSLTLTICKVQGSYVTALNKKGICQLQTSLQSVDKKGDGTVPRKVFIQVS